MLIVLCGLPGCGKTICADYLNVPEKLLISPEQMMPEEYIDSSPEINAEAKIECWKMSMKMLKAASKRPTTETIVYDACNRKARDLLDIISRYKKNHHSVYVLYVASSLADCRSRRPSIPLDVFARYIESFKQSMSMYRLWATVKVINNKSGLEAFQREVERISLELTNA